MKAFDAVVEIGAPQQAVWEAITEIGAYPLWNPLLKRVHGNFELGKPLDITFMLAGKERRVRGKVTVFAPPDELRIEVVFGAFGTLLVEHAFHLEGFEDSTYLCQRQEYSGLRATGARVWEFRSEMLPGMIAMNEALKARVTTPAGSLR